MFNPKVGHTAVETMPQTWPIRLGVIDRRGSIRCLSSVLIAYMSAIENLALDVLNEILLLTEPSDLLALTRTSVKFKTHLHSSACAKIWVRAYRNIDQAYRAPEEHPTWLDGPTLTRLLYEQECSFCGTSAPMMQDYMIHLAIGKQSCSNCYCFPNFVDHKKAQKKLGHHMRSFSRCLYRFSTGNAWGAETPQREMYERAPTPSTIRWTDKNVVYAATELEDFVKLLGTTSDPSKRRAIKKAAMADASHKGRVSIMWMFWFKSARERRQLDVAARFAALPGMPHQNDNIFSLCSFLMKPQRISDREWERAQPTLTRLLIAGRPDRWRSERRYELIAFVNQASKSHPENRSIQPYLERRDVKALLDRVGAPSAYEATMLAAFGRPIEPEAHLDREAAFEVAARVCWAPGMKKCTNPQCEWTVRGIRHAGDMDEEAARDDEPLD